MTTIAVYVADLAAYNSGFLHGAWIDATQDIEDISAQIQDMLAASPVQDSEEYAIHDYEGFEGVSLSEYEGIQSAHEKALFVEEHGTLGAGVLDYTNDIGEAEKMIEEQYAGCYCSVADYAQELTEETSTIPQHLELYIDYERMARDMEMSGDIFTIEESYGKVHIFYAR